MRILYRAPKRTGEAPLVPARAFSRTRSPTCGRRSEGEGFARARAFAQPRDAPRVCLSWAQGTRRVFDPAVMGALVLRTRRTCRHALAVTRSRATLKYNCTRRRYLRRLGAAPNAGASGGESLGVCDPLQ